MRTYECTQCGKKGDEPWVVFWATDMGNLCKACFDEIVELGPPTKRRYTEEGEKASPEAINSMRNSALAKARAVRSAKAKERAAKKAEDRERQRAVNPEAYDAKIQRLKDNLAKARAAKMAKLQAQKEQPVPAIA